MNKLILTIMIGMLLVLPLITSLENLGTFKQNQLVNITQVCSDATYINITSISYPNSTIAVSNIEMSSYGSGGYYYEFDSTLPLGRYDVLGISDGCENTFATYFIVTPTGITQTTSQGIGSFGFLILMLGLTVLMGYIGFKFTESDYLWVAGIFFLFLTILFVVYDVWLGFEYHKVLTGLNDGSKMPEIIFYIFMFLLLTSFFATTALLFTKWKKIKEWFKRGIEEQKKEDEEDEREWQ